jgi:hypothetical protein
MTASFHQDDPPNDAVSVWSAMPLTTDNPGVNHVTLPSDPGVLA